MPVIEKVVHVSPAGWLNARDAATYLGLAVSTLSNLRCHGGRPKYIRRGTIRYKQSDLDHWLQFGPDEAHTKKDAREGKAVPTQ